MRRLHLALAILVLMLLDALFAVYVFNYTTEVLDPQVQEVAGITVLDRRSSGLMAIGKEDGWIITSYSSYKNDAPITSLLMADDGLMVAFADAENRVHLYFSGTGLILWTRSFDSPVKVVDMWVRPGPFFLEPTYILVSYEGGFSLVRGPTGTTAWSYHSDESFVMRSTETGKILVGSGSRVSFFYLGSPEPYRWVSVDGPVDDVLSDAGGRFFLLLTEGEAVLYDGIYGDVLWRRGIEGPTQAALSWDGGKTFLISQSRLEIISKSGDLLSSLEVGSGQLLAPSASSYYFMLREDRIEAYYDGRPAPVWTADIGSPYTAYSTPGGTLILAWTSDRFFLLDNTNPSVASRAWLGIFGTAIVVQVFLPLLFLLSTYPLPNVGDLVASLLIGFLAGAGALFSGTLESFLELGVEGAFVAVLAASAVAALAGRRSGSPFSGLAIGLVIGVVGFLVASLLVAFYRYAFDILSTFPVVEAAIRSATLGWLLGLFGGFLGGLSAYLLPDFLRSVFGRS